jgi:Mg2+-importing ATPase
MMPCALPTPLLPERLPHEPHKPGAAIRVSQLLLEAAGKEPDEVLLELHTSKDGLSADEAERRLRQYGRNVVAREERHPQLRLLGKAVINPLVILLLVLAAASFLTSDFRAGGVMLLMVILGVVLRFGRRRGLTPQPPSSGR